MRVVGVAGWSNSGKTRLVVALVKAFSEKGLRVSTMKHAHHSFDADHKGKDSYAHREAGAHEVLVASERRWALMHECSPDEKTCTRWLSPAVLQKHLAPVDVLLVEGFKRAALDKIEVHRSLLQQDAPRPLLAASDRRIRAIVSDAPLRHSLPVFDANDPRRIADFVLESSVFLPPSIDALSPFGDAT